MTELDDIIAAIATPLGEGGIAVIRVSGRGAIELVDMGFEGSNRLSDASSHTVHHGWFIDQTGKKIDEVLATVFRLPHSYTGDDVVELSCHGGLITTKKLLSAVIAFGARLAEPGEFTKRAFLNGKLDLVQAESVAELIHATSEKAHRSSLAHLQGRLSDRLRHLMDELVELAGLVEINLDFTEEGIEIVGRDSLVKRISAVSNELEWLLGSFRFGRYYHEGVRLVIVGPPNAGKSSLFNAILDQDRAIVTEIPGTTRDVIEGSLTIAGLLYRVFDTAGLRQTIDIVESEGVRRSYEEIKHSDCCLYVVDISRESDEFVLNDLNNVSTKCQNGGIPLILVGNKSDLVEDDPEVLLEGFLIDERISSEKRVPVSARTGQDVDKLLRLISSQFSSESGGGLESGVELTSERHKALCETAKLSLVAATDSAVKNMGDEIIALHLRAAIEDLGRILGSVTTEDILKGIFSRFCIGK